MVNTNFIPDASQSVILQSSNHGIQTIYYHGSDKKDSPDSQPDYKLIEEHIKVLRYMYMQREKAIEDGKKKEEEARKIWK